MQVYGNNVAPGGGYGGDIKTPLPSRTFREKPKTPESPTKLRFPSDIPANKVRYGTSRKGVKLGPRPDGWVNPLAADSSKLEEAVVRYLEGETVINISKDLGISRQTIYKHFRIRGVATKK